MNYSDKEQAVSILKNYQQNRFREDRMLTHFFSFCKNLHLKSINYHICLISLGNSHPLIGKSDLAIQPLTLEKQISPNRKILLLWEIVREAKWSWVHSPQDRKNVEVKCEFFHSNKLWKVILKSSKNDNLQVLNSKNYTCFSTFFIQKQSKYFMYEKKKLFLREIRVLGK